MAASSLNDLQAELSPEIIGKKSSDSSVNHPTVASLELAEQALEDIKLFLATMRKGAKGADKDANRFDSHQRARQEFRFLQKRNSILGSDLFSDPAWDILLLLYSSLPERDFLIVREFSTMAAIPVTTALRWVAILENRGLVARRVDQNDRRAVNVSITERGCDLMARSFTE